MADEPATGATMGWPDSRWSSQLHKIEGYSPNVAAHDAECRCSRRRLGDGLQAATERLSAHVHPDGNRDEWLQFCLARMGRQDPHSPEQSRAPGWEKDNDRLRPGLSR